MSAKWERQPGLFDYAKSRWDNPETSKEAAESIGLERVSEMQQKILEVFKFNGREMSDETLVELYEGYWPNSATDQSIRSRRGELVRKGRLFDTGKRGVTRFNRRCVIWRLAR
ncbi:MAG: hypothetical protein ACR2MC_06690 [Actinomycetota bacterium]